MLQMLQKTIGRVHMHSLTQAGTSPLLKDKLALVSNILNEGYLTGLQQRSRCISPTLVTFHSSLPSTGVRCT